MTGELRPNPASGGDPKDGGERGSAGGSLRRVIAGVLPATLAVQLCSFASAIAVATVLGASTATDAYYLALSIPLLVYGILLSGLRSGAIPELTDQLRAGPELFAKAVGQLLSAVLILSLVLTCVGTGLALLVLPQLAGEVSAGLISSARSMVVSLAPIGVIGALAGALGALLTVRGRPVSPVAVLAFDPLLRTLFVIFLGPALGTSALIAGNLAGGALAVLSLAYLLIRRERISLHLMAPARSSFLLGVLGVSLPLMVGQGFAQLSPLASRTVASTLGPGSITVFELGLRVFSLPVALLGSVMIAPLTAAWAARYQDRGWAAVSRSFGNALAGLLVVLPPIVVLGIALRGELMGLLFDGGAYSAEAVNQTASVFGMLLLGLPAQLVVILLATLFLVRKDAVVPMLIAVANVALTVGLALALRPSLGLAGIALATSLTFTIVCAVYFAVASRRLGALEVGWLGGTLARAVVSTVLIALTAWLVLSVLPGPEGKLGYIFTIGATGGAGIIVHLLMLILAREPEVRRALPRSLRAPRTGA
jgi:putative peptidoglycan lipid II flippase